MRTRRKKIRDATTKYFTRNKLECTITDFLRMQLKKGLALLKVECPMFKRQGKEIWVLT